MWGVVGASVVGVRAQGVMGMPGVHGQVTTSLFDRVMVVLGSRLGWEGVAGQPCSGCMGSGLATQGATLLLDRVAAGGAVGMGVCARGATSVLGRGTACSGSAHCFDAVM